MSGVTNVNSMFENASNFNLNLKDWSDAASPKINAMFSSSGLSTTNKAGWMPTNN